MCEHRAINLSSGRLYETWSWLYCSPSRWTLASVCRISGSVHSDIMWDPWWAIWHWSLFFSQLLCFSPATTSSRLRLKCDGTHTESRFCLSAKWTSPFKCQFSRLLAAEVCASAIVMLDTPFSEVVWTVLATNSIRQFPLHFPSLASPCAITFQLESTTTLKDFKSSYSLYVCLSLSLSLSLLNGCTVEHSSIIAPRTRGAQ